MIFIKDDGSTDKLKIINYLNSIKDNIIDYYNKDSKIACHFTNTNGWHNQGFRKLRLNHIWHKNGYPTNNIEDKYELILFNEITFIDSIYHIYNNDNIYKYYTFAIIKLHIDNNIITDINIKLKLININMEYNNDSNLYILRKGSDICIIDIF